jgi:hypothetical protein
MWLRKFSVEGLGVVCHPKAVPTVLSCTRQQQSSKTLALCSLCAQAEFECLLAAIRCMSFDP